jgi:hypothetical protein
VKGSWIAARSYLQSAIDAGCRERFAWRWLATSLLALGEFAKAEEIICQWEAMDPASPEPAQFRASLPAAEEVRPATAAEVAGRALNFAAAAREPRPASSNRAGPPLRAKSRSTPPLANLALHFPFPSSALRHRLTRRKSTTCANGGEGDFY